MDPLKIGLYVLLALPGFIFVQVHEHHLLRERKPQFEKTLEIVLASALIWIVALFVPRWWPWEESRQWVVQEISSVLSGGSQFGSPGRALRSVRLCGEFFFGVCLWTLVAANLWGSFRKYSLLNAFIKYVTGRDWYPSVALRFFERVKLRVVVVTTKNRRYGGVLFSAPDAREDGHIILKDVALLPDEELAAKSDSRLVPVPLPLVEFLLIRLDEVLEIRALKKDILSPAGMPKGGRRHGHSSAKTT
jgi:uncharacterized protein DUF6338